MTKLSFASTMLLACVASAQSISGTGLLSGTVSSRASGINLDGSVVVGTSNRSDGTTRAFRFINGSFVQDQSCGISAAFYTTNLSGAAAGGGSVSPGPAMSATRWDSPNPCPTVLAQPANYGAAMMGMDSTGNTMAGYCQFFGGFGPYARPWLWIPGGFNIQLPLPGIANAGSASGVSSDASVIVGDTGVQGIFYGAQATYWDSGGAHPMGVLQPLGTYSVSAACSSNGQVIVGWGDNGGSFGFTPGPMHAFRWAGGFADLGLLSGAPANGVSHARDVSEDGSVVVGDSSTATGQAAFIWLNGFGMMPLDLLLPQLGVNLTGWTLLECNGISADGTALCGTGVFGGVTQGYVVRGLPPLCGPLIMNETPYQNHCPGDYAGLWVAGIMPAHTTYQWYRRYGSYPLYLILPVSNGGSVGGATTDNLVINPIQPGDAGDYFCRITGGCATVDSPITGFIVHGPPTVTLQPPLDLQPCAYSFTNITIGASSTFGTISYRWQAEMPFMSGNWVNLADGIFPGIGTVFGVFGPSLTLSNFYFGGHTTYRCRLTNSCGVSYPQSTLINPCFADFNCDATIDFFDYLDFIAAYSANDPSADINKDGSVDFFDYLDFVNFYSAGCY